MKTFRLGIWLIGLFASVGVAFGAAATVSAATCASQGGALSLLTCAGNQKAISADDATGNQVCCVASLVCFSVNGVCTTSADCASNSQYSNKGAASDCTDSAKPICCVKTLTNQLPTSPALPIASCTSNGGYCAATCTGKDTSIGIFDCTGVGQCCKQSGTVAPVPTQTGGGASSGGVSPTAGGTSLTSGAGAGTSAAPPTSLYAAFPPNVQACMKTGNCKLDDLVDAGVGFARFLMGLSGAIFFLIFIIGGGYYLMSFGDAGMVKKGKGMIKGAAIGIIIVMSAWTMVKYLVGTLAPGYFSNVSGTAASGKATCASIGKNWSCQTLIGNSAADVSTYAASVGLVCQSGLCPGDFHNLCCSSF